MAGPNPSGVSAPLSYLLLTLGHLWMLPVSIIGILWALATGCKPVRVDGDLAVYFVARPGWPAYWWFRKFGFAGFTLGTAITFVEVKYLWNQRIIRHEKRHVTQCMYQGVFSLITYPAASLLAVIQGKHHYHDNLYEVDARAHEGE